MKAVEAGLLMDMTNMIKEHTDRSKPPPRKPISKIIGSTLLADG